jgi:hypothetical protein
MGWLDDLGDAAKNAGDWVSDTASGALDSVTDAASDAGNWVSDTASDAWESVTDFFKAEEPPVSEVELDAAPTEDQVWEALDTIRPILLEGYRRQEAHDRFGHWPALYPISGGHLTQHAGGYVHGEGSSNWATLGGYYRESETLGFLMPAAIPDEVAEFYHNGKDMQASWVVSTESDDEDIHNAAQAATIVNMGQIEELYRELLAQCDLPAMGELLPKLNAVCAKTKEIYETHTDREAIAIKEVWDEWKADEIQQTAANEFGGRLRQVLPIHWDGASAIVYAASQEATAQTHAVVQAYNNIAGTWDLILAKLNQSAAADQAISKYVATITVNRIPFAGDVVATTDFIVEASTSGEVQSPASNFINGIIDRLSGKDVPDGDTCAEVVKMLTEGAQDCIEGLDEARGAYTEDILRPTAESWDGYWQNGFIDEIIPGYLP